jgi:hypothetical protein
MDAQEEVFEARIRALEGWRGVRCLLQYPVPPEEGPAGILFVFFKDTRKYLVVLQHIPDK